MHTYVPVNRSGFICICTKHTYRWYILRSRSHDGRSRQGMGSTCIVSACPATHLVVISQSQASDFPMTYFADLPNRPCCSSTCKSNRFGQDVHFSIKQQGTLHGESNEAIDNMRSVFTELLSGVRWHMWIESCVICCLRFWCRTHKCPHRLCCSYKDEGRPSSPPRCRCCLRLGVRSCQDDSPGIQDSCHEQRS